MEFIPNSPKITDGALRGYDTHPTKLQNEIIELGG